MMPKKDAYLTRLDDLIQRFNKLINDYQDETTQQKSPFYHYFATLKHQTISSPDHVDIHPANKMNQCLLDALKHHHTHLMQETKNEALIHHLHKIKGMVQQFSQEQTSSEASYHEKMLSEYFKAFEHYVDALMDKIFDLIDSFYPQSDQQIIDTFETFDLTRLTETLAAKLSGIFNVPFDQHTHYFQDEDASEDIDKKLVKMYENKLEDTRNDIVSANKKHAEIMADYEKQIDNIEHKTKQSLYKKYAQTIQEERRTVASLQKEIKSLRFKIMAAEKKRDAETLDRLLKEYNKKEKLSQSTAESKIERIVNKKVEQARNNLIEEKRRVELDHHDVLYELNRSLAVEKLNFTESHALFKIREDQAALEHDIKLNEQLFQNLIVFTESWIKYREKMIEFAMTITAHTMNQTKQYLYSRADLLADQDKLKHTLQTTQLTYGGTLRFEDLIGSKWTIALYHEHKRLRVRMDYNHLMNQELNEMKHKNLLNIIDCYDDTHKHLYEFFKSLSRHRLCLKRKAVLLNFKNTVQESSLHNMTAAFSDTKKSFIDNAMESIVNTYDHEMEKIRVFADEEMARIQALLSELTDEQDSALSDETEENLQPETTQEESIRDRLLKDISTWQTSLEAMVKAIKSRTLDVLKGFRDLGSVEYSDISDLSLWRSEEDEALAVCEDTLTLEEKNINQHISQLQETALADPTLDKIGTSLTDQLEAVQAQEDRALFELEKIVSEDRIELDASRKDISKSFYNKYYDSLKAGIRTQLNSQVKQTQRHLKQYTIKQTTLTSKYLRSVQRKISLMDKDLKKAIKSYKKYLNAFNKNMSAKQKALEKALKATRKSNQQAVKRKY